MNNNLTKQKILTASIRLFNWNDTANVRLQQIADETGISVGNLVYHFKNKEAIVSAVYETIFSEFYQLLSAYLSNPDLADFDQQMENYHRFFCKYKFYLIDLYEVDRAYPQIMERWQECFGKMLVQIRKRLDYNVSQGILQPEPEPGMGIYNTMTNNISMTIVFWIPQQLLKGQPVNESKFKHSVWAQIAPHFTPKGLEEFKREIQPILLA